jgi:tetratricopeptide (TPR) repeat protein
MSDWIDAEAHADRALEWFERGRWAEAESELRKAISLNPDQPEWHFNLALTLEAAGRDPEALASYEHAVDLMPGQVEPLVAAGAVCNRLGHVMRALDKFDEALRLDRRCEAAYANRMESLLRLGDHDELETCFYLAQQEISDPSASCLAVMADSLVTRGAFDRAEWCLKEALRLDPGIPRLRARLGSVMAATSRPQRALQLYLRDLRDDPGNLDTLLDFGELLMDMQRYPDASEKFKRVLEVEPANVDAHYQLGRIAMLTRRYEQAHLEFELVCKLDPGYPRIRLDLARALLRRELHRDARACLQAELDHLRAADQAGRLEGSDDAMLTALAVFDQGGAESVTMLRELGSLLVETDLAAEAAGVFQRAIDASAAADADLYRQLALAHFRAGHREAGVVASRRALRADPTCVRSIHNLALAALETGRLRLAAGWVARGLSVDRHDVGIRRLRMRLWAAVTTRRLRRLFG